MKTIYFLAISTCLLWKIKLYIIWKEETKQQRAVNTLVHCMESSGTCPSWLLCKVQTHHWSLFLSFQHLCDCVCAGYIIQHILSFTLWKHTLSFMVSYAKLTVDVTGEMNTIVYIAHPTIKKNNIKIPMTIYFLPQVQYQPGSQSYLHFLPLLPSPISGLFLTDITQISILLYTMIWLVLPELIPHHQYVQTHLDELNSCVHNLCRLLKTSICYTSMTLMALQHSKPFFLKYTWNSVPGDYQ